MIITIMDHYNDNDNEDEDNYHDKVTSKKHINIENVCSENLRNLYNLYNFQLVRKKFKGQF